LKGGVSLLWYKSSQFMGLKNTWFFISSCRKKALVRSSPPHRCLSHSSTSSRAPTLPATGCQLLAVLAGFLGPERALKLPPSTSSRTQTLTPRISLFHSCVLSAFFEHWHCAVLWRHVSEQEKEKRQLGDIPLPHSASAHLAFLSFPECNPEK
jgi:hypothetical protein